MQIKPALLSYKELWKEFVCKDDLGNDYYFICAKVTHSINHRSIYPRRFGIGGLLLKIKLFREKKTYTNIIYRVLCEKETHYSNGAIGREEQLFWNHNHHCLRRILIRNFRLYELYEGPTALIENGVRTSFLIVKCSLWSRFLNLFNS